MQFITIGWEANLLYITILWVKSLSVWFFYDNKWLFLRIKKSYTFRNRIQS